MRFATFAVIASLGAGALAQAQLPKCAASCVGSNFGSCQTIDIGCICGRKEWIAELSCCVSQKCDQKDTDATIQFANDICIPAGVTDLPKTASCPSSAAPTSSAPTPATTGSMSMTGSMSDMMSSMSMSGSSKSGSASSAASSATSSASSAANAAAASATSNAAVRQEVGAGLAAIAGLMMAL